MSTTSKNVSLVARNVEKLVKTCSHCTQESIPRKEPLMPTALPEYPWQKVGSDMFTLNGANYVIVTDYFSRFPEVVKLTTTTSGSIISTLKSIFSRFGIPEEAVSDNGPQYASREFQDFGKAYNFKHTTSSPHFPQSNGHAERAVQTVKKLLKGSDDPYMSLLSYRSTPLPWCGLSPAELWMGRQVRSNIPQTSDTLKPQWPYLGDFRQSNQKLKAKQKANYDSSHGPRPLAEIPDDTTVWVTTENQHSPGRVAAHADAPRSYLVQTPVGQIRRNRAHLTIRPDPESPDRKDPTETTTGATRSPIMTRSRTGSCITPPARL